uniref:Uncharacterized protein n=1 Tax=Bosea sp. NBC_00436 TaxID=2969620 RepID=A0A9E8A1L1_9HYPH
MVREEWRRSRQGKKVAMRCCGEGDRGEAGLRPDLPIDEIASVRSPKRDGIGDSRHGDLSQPHAAGSCPFSSVIVEPYPAGYALTSPCLSAAADASAIVAMFGCAG